MSDLQRWEQLRDAEAIGEPVTPQQHAWLEAHDDPDAQLERTAYAQLAALGNPDDIDATTRQRALDTVAAFTAEPPRRRRRLPAVLAVTAVTVAASVALLWVGRPTSTVVDPIEQDAVVTSGTLMLDEAALGPGASLPTGQWVVARTASCVQTRGATSCVDEATRLRVRDDTLEIATGKLHFTGSGGLVTPFVTIAASDASFRLHASASPRSAMRVVAESGEVVLRDPLRGEQVLPPGQRRTFGDEATAIPETDPAPHDEADEGSGPATDDAPQRARRPRDRRQPSAGELLVTARDHVARGRRKDALGTYATLQRRHPGSPEARAAHVSVGQLQLDRGRSKAALRAFERYLATGKGPLTEEAHWGRIRALHRLGRRQARDEAIETLREDYPRSVYLNLAARL